MDNLFLIMVKDIASYLTEINYRNFVNFLKAPKFVSVQIHRLSIFCSTSLHGHIFLNPQLHVYAINSVFCMVVNLLAGVQGTTEAVKICIYFAETCTCI